MAQGTSSESEINSKLVEYLIEMLFDENAAIDRIQPRIEEESPTFHVRVESNYDLWSIAIHTNILRHLCNDYCAEYTQR